MTEVEELKTMSLEEYEKNSEEAERVTITEDTSLPPAKCVKINVCSEHRDDRVKVSGWIQRIRREGKTLMFIVLRDGTGYLQAVLNDKLCQTYNAVLLSPESTVTLYGIITKVPEGQSAPGGHELICDYWELVGLAPSGGINAVLNQNSDVDIMLDNRHLVIRGEQTSKILRVRSYLMQAIRDHYYARGYCEVTPPTIVQAQCEPCSTPFKIDYFGEELYLSQTAQHYIETCMPALGNVFSFTQSYRAEPSMTRRHLAEYTHIEMASGFITFNDLLDYTEDLICDVVDRVLKSPVGQLIKDLNPDFEPPKRPFKRMDYSEAIVYLREHNIKKEDGSLFEYGDEITEIPERKMVDQINEPILLCRFPVKLKSFYMQTCPENQDLTESVDVLMPNVGEIVGGSMQTYKYDQLIDAYKKEGADASLYYWHTDQIKFGAFPHGGYGLGLERLLTWLCNRYHIRDVCLYPRYIGRCRP